MPDEKDLHDPRNPCYDDKPKKLFISKPKLKVGITYTLTGLEPTPDGHLTTPKDNETKK